MTDEGTAPEGGQGTTESGGGIFDPYLQAVPETWEQPPSGSPRDVVSKYLSDAEKGVNSRLSEAADIQKRFGPYNDIDLSGWEPDRLQNVLGWVEQMSNDEDAFKAWLKEAATEAGILQAEQEPDEPGDLTPEKIQEIVNQAIQQQIAPLQQQTEQQKHAENLRNLEGQIDSQFSALEKEHGVQFTDDQKLAIGDLGESHEGDDWIEVGFKRFQALAGNAQAEFIKGNSGQPAPPVKGGGQEAPTRSTDFREAGKVAEERLRQFATTT